MTDQNTEILNEPEAVVVSPEAEKDSVLQKAISMGFKPDRASFKGTDEDYTDNPREYLKRKEVKEHINTLHKKTKEQQAALDYLIAHNAKLEEIAYKKALEELQAKHIQAVKSGDVQTAVKVNSELLNLEKEKPQPIVPPAIKRFREENASWFNKSTPENAAMYAYAEAQYQAYQASNPGCAIEDAVEYAEKTVKQQFPSKFGGLHRVAPAEPVAETSSSDRSSSAKLPKEIRDIIMTLKGTKERPGSNPNFNVERFIEQCKKKGAI